MLSVILFLTFYFYSQDPDQTKKLAPDDLIVYGSCYDVLTGKDLQIKATALFRNKKLDLGNSNGTGTFDFQIPDSTKFLSFEIAGYNSTIIPVNILGKIEKGSKFKVSVPMIAKDSQQLSQVYQQPLDKSKAPDPQKLIDGIRKVSFEVKDAHIGQLIRAKVCLNYTQTGQTKCYDLDSTTAGSSLTVNQKDKIAFIISSNGYQDYIGNLINDQAENKEEFHKIRLLRSVNPLCLYFDVSDSLEVNYVITHNQTLATSFTYQRGKHPTFNYLYFIKPGQYQFTASTSDGIELMNDKISTGPGFNFKSVRLRMPKSKKTDIPKPDNINAKFEPLENTTLYFDQSSYNLRNETRSVLDSISQFLPRRPNLIVNITGYTDNVGKRDLNLRLSEYRARVVVNYLKHKGIQEKQISFSWKGPDSPAAANDTEENKLKNRRVEIHFLGN